MPLKYDFHAFSVTCFVFGEMATELCWCVHVCTVHRSVPTGPRALYDTSGDLEPPLNFRHTQHFASLEMSQIFGSHSPDVICLRSMGRSVTCV